MIFTNSFKVALYYLITLWIIDIVMEWLINFINIIIDKISTSDISLANFISGLPDRRSMIVTYLGLTILWILRIYISLLFLTVNTIE